MCFRAVNEIVMSTAAAANHHSHGHAIRALIPSAMINAAAMTPLPDPERRRRRLRVRGDRGGIGG
jgi:hypothetical protein